MLQEPPRFIHVPVTESKKERERRLAGQREHKELRSAKLERTRHKGAHDDVAIANIFRDLGIDFLSVPRDQAFSLLKTRLEGRKVSTLSERGLTFLKENFDVEQVGDSDGRTLLHFLEAQSEKEDDPPMRLYTQIGEEAGQPRKVVRVIFETFEKLVRAALKAERAVKIPGIGKLTVKYRAAKEKRKGINPFTKEKCWFKAKPASNRLRFRPAKQLKVYVGKLAVVPPPKKHKKGKKSKKHGRRRK